MLLGTVYPDHTLRGSIVFHNYLKLRPTSYGNGIDKSFGFSVKIILLERATIKPNSNIVPFPITPSGLHTIIASDLRNLFICIYLCFQASRLFFRGSCPSRRIKSVPNGEGTILVVHGLRNVVQMLLETTTNNNTSKLLMDQSSHCIR